MKSLQIVTPHTKCIYNCPFCIAKGHIHNNLFVNNYHDNYELWKNNLINVIKENDDLKYVVITGTNEPMQSRDCVNNIIDIIRSVNKDIQIEIQTRSYKEDIIYNKLDVVAYSISNIRLLDKIKPMGKIKRYVIILTDSFNNYKLKDIINLIHKEVNQITFKVLQDSHGVNKSVDDYIINHNIDKDTLDNLINDINNYKGDKSIRIDLNCMDSNDRYKIFREDGYVYSNWDEM